MQKPIIKAGYNKQLLLQNTSVSFLLVCFALFLISINMRAPIIMIGSIAPLLEQDLNIGATQIGWLGAIPVTFFAISALCSARVSQRFGIENVLPAMTALLFIGMVFRVLLVNWWVFLFGTVLLSIAIGFLNTLAMPAIKKLAPHRVSLVTGLYSLNMTICAGTIAGVIVPMSEQIGWRFSTASWAIFSVFAVFVWLVLRPHLTTRKAYKRVKKTEQTIESNNNNAATNQKSFSVWKSKFAWHLAIFFGIQSLIYYLAASFLPSIFIEKGLSIKQAGNMAMLFQLMAPVAIILLMLVMNRAEKIHRIRVANTKLGISNSQKLVNYPRVIAVFAASIVALGTTGMTLNGIADYGTSQLIFWAATCSLLSGFGASLIFTLCLMLISLRTHDVAQAGEFSGMAQTVAYTIAIFGPLTAGWLHELNGSWQLPLILLTILMIINIGFAWLATGNNMIDGAEIR